MTHGAMRQPLADTLTAIGSILYLLVSFVTALWMLFDTWINVHTVPALLGYDVQPLRNPDYHTMVSAVIGGTIGGVVNGLRSALHYSRSFDRRFVWKYVSAPWMGAALALLAYAVLTTSAAVLGGQTAAAPAAAAPQLLSNFAIGALAGYGAKDAFIWLDAQVHKLFAVPEAIPDVEGQPEAVAMSRIEAQQLTVGAVAEVPDGLAAAGTVVSQEPAPGTHASRGDSVDLTVASGQSPALATVGSGPAADVAAR